MNSRENAQEAQKGFFQFIKSVLAHFARLRGHLHCVGLRAEPASCEHVILTIKEPRLEVMVLALAMFLIGGCFIRSLGAPTADWRCRQLCEWDYEYCMDDCEDNYLLCDFSCDKAGCLEYCDRDDERIEEYNDRRGWVYERGNMPR